ncbi:MAG: lysophospholipid acyltransferase family protein [Deltaproteobacteria bacterium]|nr:lysophospholipid acyltransferase family protein [Deltaproteobacteria bacterium]
MLAHKNIIKDIGRLFFWFPVRWGVKLMSFPVVYSLGTLLGNLDYYSSGRQCIERMKTNLIETLGYSQSKADRIIKQNLQHHSRNVLEFIKYPQINSKNMGNFINFKGIEYLDQELAKGNGVILMTAHFGAKQILQVGLGHLGYPLTQLHYHMKRQELTWVQKNVSQKQRIFIENKLPVNFLSSKGFLGSAVKRLKKNQILLLTGDGIGLKQHMDKGYHSFNFLGRTMLFPTGSIAIAKFTGSAILPIFAIRNKHRHRIIIESPLDVENGDYFDVMKQYIRILEKYIRTYPSLWEFWEEFEPGVLIDESKMAKMVTK